MPNADRAKAFRRALRDLDLTQGEFRDLLNITAASIPGIAPVSADTISRYATGRYRVNAGVAAFLALLGKVRALDAVPATPTPTKTTAGNDLDAHEDELVERFATVVDSTPPHRWGRIERMMRSWKQK